MPEGIEPWRNLDNPGRSISTPKPAVGTSDDTINTLFKRKSLFKPKSQEASSQKCQSRLVAPHQEPFAPTFENHTGSSRTVASSWPPDLVKLASRRFTRLAYSALTCPAASFCRQSSHGHEVRGHRRGVCVLRSRNARFPTPKTLHTFASRVRASGLS